MKNFKGFRNVRKTIETYGDISILWPITFLSGSEVLNPLQSGPEFTPWDLARTSDPERNMMGQSIEMSPYVSMVFRTFLNPLKFFMKIVYILDICISTHKKDYHALTLFP